MKERKIGEEFELNLRVKVVESDEPCLGCIFEHYDSICPNIKTLGPCSDYARSDKKEVHFEFVN